MSKKDESVLVNYVRKAAMALVVFIIVNIGLTMPSQADDAMMSSSECMDYLKKTVGYITEECYSHDTYKFEECVIEHVLEDCGVDNLPEEDEAWQTSSDFSQPSQPVEQPPNKCEEMSWEDCQRFNGEP